MKKSVQTRSRINLFFASDSYTLKRFLKDSDTTRDALLLWGEKNKVASLEKEGLYHKEFCGIGKLHVLKGCGHLLMAESPEETNQLIKNYLEN